jgi:hypothetical protein
LDYDAFNKSIEMGVFIKDLTGNYPYLGQVWPGPTHVPDNATAYWTEQLRRRALRRRLSRYERAVEFLRRSGLRQLEPGQVQRSQHRRPRLEVPVA